MDITKPATPGIRALLLALGVVLIVPAMAAAATFTVRAEGETWKPARRVIVKGDRIVWRNPTARKHDVTARGSNWSYRVVLYPGDSAQRRFWTTGRFRYRCALHSGIIDGRCEGMCGVIVVQRP